MRRVEMGTQNALELLRFGRLTAREGEPFDVPHGEKTYRLRHYGPSADAPKRLASPLLLVPPLMVSADVYDVAPEISSVAALRNAGIDVWLVDFGAPEDEEGGMERTLDDHVRAVADAVRRVRAVTGHDVHVAGYSQGGMFVYQAAAYTRGEGIASLITFGSPVHIHRNLPGISEGATEQILRVARSLAEGPLQKVEGLPGFLTSTGFKLLSPRKEVEQIVDFVRKLHDRQALVKRESRRRFLGGEGFVAWPGPALRKFIDEFVVHNRLVSGGFVIDGRTVTLADIDKPILCFIGERDEIARPAAIRAIRDAAPSAEVFEVRLPAGHFGLVVGSTALAKTWPTVVEWLRWRERLGPRPLLIPAPVPRAEPDPEDADLGADLDFDLFYDAALDTLYSAVRKLNDATDDAGDVFDSIRYQLPRLARLERLSGSTKVGVARELGRRARTSPGQTFFLWQGRAFTFAEADRRVDAVVKGLTSQGIRRGQRVAVLMDGRPSFLTMVTALNRLGAIAVVLPPDLEGESLARALEITEASALVTDPEHAALGRARTKAPVLVLGGGGGGTRALPEGVVDMEAIDPDAVQLPAWYEPDSLRARDLAMVLVRTGTAGRLDLHLVTNGRWAFSAIGTAAACTITPKDTVYCCLPVHHPTGLLVAVGSALVGGARLAIGSRFTVPDFWDEVHRYGATIAFYAGDMVRALVDAERRPLDRKSSLRLFAGSGMRRDVWERIGLRFGAVGVMEFYASTEVNLVLANASGEKVGSLGRPLPGCAETRVAAFDPGTRELRRDPWGRVVECGSDEPGVLLARLGSDATKSDPIVDAGRLGDRVRRDVFEPGDAWFVTGDVVRRDADGDYWYEDRLTELVRTPTGVVSTRTVEDALVRVSGVAEAAVVAAPGDGGETPVAFVVAREGSGLRAGAVAESLRTTLAANERPSAIHVVDALPKSEGFRVLKSRLRERLAK